MVHKYGRHPVGGFLSHPTQDVLKLGVAPAMFMSATHDNDQGHMRVCGERECSRREPCTMLLFRFIIILCTCKEV